MAITRRTALALVPAGLAAAMFSPEARAALPETGEAFDKWLDTYILRWADVTGMGESEYFEEMQWNEFVEKYTRLVRIFETGKDPVDAADAALEPWDSKCPRFSTTTAEEFRRELIEDRLSKLQGELFSEI
jgi:hypothetical protein